MAKKKPYYVWTVFLIKSDFQDDSSILNTAYAAQLAQHAVVLADDATATLYVKRAYPAPPKWAKILGNAVSPPIEEKSQRPSALMIVRSAGRIFGLTFGSGKALLQAESWEQEFGLKFVLNSVDEDSIREIELSGFDALLQNKQAQSVRDANIDEFEFDVDLRSSPRPCTRRRSRRFLIRPRTVLRGLVKCWIVRREPAQTVVSDRRGRISKHKPACRYQCPAVRLRAYKIDFKVSRIDCAIG